MRPVDSWSAEEREKLVLLERGIPVAMHMRRHDDVIAWAKQRGEVLGPCWRPSDSTRRARSAGAGEAAAPNRPLTGSGGPPMAVPSPLSTSPGLADTGGEGVAMQDARGPGARARPGERGREPPPERRQGRGRVAASNAVRWTGAAGVIAALILVAGFPLYLIMGTPPSVSDASRYAEYLTRINGWALATKLVDTVYVAGFIVFLVGIRELIRNRGAEYEWAATPAITAGLASAVVTLVGDVLGAAAALDTYSSPDPAVIRALTEANLPAFGAIGLSMTVLFLVPASWGILATGALPRWTGWTGYAVALTTAIAIPAIFGGGDFLNATVAGGGAAAGVSSYSTSIAGLAFIAWLLIVGVCMFRSTRSETTERGRF